MNYKGGNTKNKKVFSINKSMKYDVLIVGAGPAGMTAGIYCGRAGLKTLIIDKAEAGGTLLEISQIENYPGFEGAGRELAKRMKEHAMKYCEIKEFCEVERIEKKDDGFFVKSCSGDFEARAIIIATGANPKKLEVPGEKEFLGRGVSYCAVCDGFFFKGKKVAVIGGGDSAFTDAIYLRDLGCDVYLIHRRRGFRAEQCKVDRAKEKGIECIVPYVLKRIEGEKMVERIVIENVETGEERVLDVSGVFIRIGQRPKVDFADVALDENGYVKVNEKLMTSVEGIFAAGDVVGAGQVVIACGQGARAALEVREWLERKG